jgi:hypothetical protein
LIARGVLSLAHTRHRLLTRGLATALALLTCGSAFDWGHAGGDDPEFSVALVHHDHTAHRFRPAPSSPSQPAEHCYICHSLRLLHAALAARRGCVVFSLQSIPHCQVGRVAVRNAPGVALSSRAPPFARL